MIFNPASAFDRADAIALPRADPTAAPEWSRCGKAFAIRASPPRMPLQQTVQPATGITLSRCHKTRDTKSSVVCEKAYQRLLEVCHTTGALPCKEQFRLFGQPRQSGPSKPMTMAAGCGVRIGREFAMFPAPSGLKTNYVIQPDE
jgi:hypothetical protein